MEKEAQNMGDVEKKQKVCISGSIADRFSCRVTSSMTDGRKQLGHRLTGLPLQADVTTLKHLFPGEELQYLKMRIEKLHMLPFLHTNLAVPHKEMQL